MVSPREDERRSHRWAVLLTVSIAAFSALLLSWLVFGLVSDHPCCPLTWESPIEGLSGGVMALVASMERPCLCVRVAPIT